MRKVSAFNLVALALGLAFLYLPIAVLVIYSFNASRLVGIWGGWSTRWYAALLDDPDMLDSASISLRLAALSASLATILGTLGARSEEHTSELQSQFHLVCRLLLEKK